MSEEIHGQIVGFLSGEFARTEGRQCTSVELVTAQPGMRGESIGAWERKEKPELFEGQAHVEDLTTEILRIAEAHADTFDTGAHRYEVRTRQHLGGIKKRAFRLYSSGEIEQGTEGDPPTERGLTGQLMRHIESKEKTMTQMVGTTIGVMSRMVQDFAEENRELRRDRIAVSGELEEARSRKDERELENIRQISADQRKDKAFEKIMQLLPIVANRVLGSGTQDQAPMPMAIMTSELADSLSEEQLMKIAGVLHPSQLGLLAELIQTAKATTAKEDDAQKASQAKAASGG